MYCFWLIPDLIAFEMSSTLPPPPSPDAFTYRLLAVEKEVQDLRTQVQTYVPMREHELQLRIIRDAVDRIEKQVTDLATQSGMQQKAQNEQQQSQDKLIIRLQWGIISGIVGLVLAIIGGVAIFYFTHLP